MGKTSVLVADNHTILREGLKRILTESDGIHITGEASSRHEILKKVANEKYDVLLLDISMLEIDGLHIIKDLKNNHPELAILALSSFPEELYAASVLKAGASGYLTKESAPSDLIEAIRKVSQGGRYVSSSLAETAFINPDVDMSKSPHERLSTREFQVMRMLASGKTVSEIATDLSLSVKTVSTNRARLLQKMGMKNNAELIHYAIKSKLVE